MTPPAAARAQTSTPSRRGRLQDPPPLKARRSTDGA